MTESMYFELTIRHHDHAYVESRGGHAFFSHLRGAPSRCAYRRRALEGAHRLYHEARDRGDEESRLSGLGLLVLQRALLCAEDLGALLYALDREDAWQRLTGYRVPDIEGVFLGVHTDPEQALAQFRLPADQELASELSDCPVALEGARELCRRTRLRWLYMLEGVINLWLRNRDVAKATMHGYPVIAGDRAVGTPSAGMISDALRDPGVRPFAAALISTVEGSHVTTAVHAVPLDPTAVDSFARNGKLAIKLVEELCAAQAGGIERGYGYMLPLEFLARLPEQQREALEGRVGRE